jgi:hypothetical protein
MAVLEQLVLDRIELVRIQPGRREDGHAIVIGILADDDVAAAEVGEVVRERTDRAQDRVRIPSGLVLDPFALDRALAQQILEVDRQTRHGDSPSESGQCLGAISRHLPSPPVSAAIHGPRRRVRETLEIQSSCAIVTLTARDHLPSVKPCSGGPTM